MSITKLLSTVPDVNAFWEKNGATLTTLGIAKTDIDSVATLLEIQMILLALKGDIAANKYIDERARMDGRALERKAQNSRGGHRE
jgi:hypothetical protein